MMNLEDEFRAEALRDYAEAAALGYNATVWRHMIDQWGAVEATRRLLYSKEFSDGFRRLWELKRLDLSVEALLLKPQFASLFTEEERTIAREKLRELEYRAPWDTQR
jgi:hypothetical protein